MSIISLSLSLIILNVPLIIRHFTSWVWTEYFEVIFVYYFSTPPFKNIEMFSCPCPLSLEVHVPQAYFWLARKHSPTLPPRWIETACFPVIPSCGSQRSVPWIHFLAPPANKTAGWWSSNQYKCSDCFPSPGKPSFCISHFVQGK